MRSVARWLHGGRGQQQRDHAQQLARPYIRRWLVQDKGAPQCLLEGNIAIVNDLSRL